MALNTYLHLKVAGIDVPGSVTQSGRVGQIEVNSFEWSFDSSGKLGEVKFTSDLDKATVPIGQALKSQAAVDAVFDFWTPSNTGAESLYFKLHGKNGKVTSVNLWQLNNNDPNLMRYATTMEYTMSFAAVDETWMADSTTVTIP